MSQFKLIGVIMGLFTAGKAWDVTTMSEESLWHECKVHKNERARNELILKYAGLVKYVIDRLMVTPPPSVEQTDLYNSGILGLIDAVDKFDLNYGTNFKTYAIIRIRGSILDEGKKSGWLPRSVRRKQLALEKTYLKLEHELGHPPDDEQVAEALSMDLEELYQLLAELQHSTFLSLHDFIDSRCDGGVLHIIDTISIQDTPPDIAVEISELLEGLAEAIDALPEQEKTVISLYYYQDLTLKEVGRVMKVSEARVSQIHTKAVIRLRGKLQRFM